MNLSTEKAIGKSLYDNAAIREQIAARVRPDPKPFLQNVVKKVYLEGSPGFVRKQLGVTLTSIKKARKAAKAEKLAAIEAVKAEQAARLAAAISEQSADLGMAVENDTSALAVGTVIHEAIEDVFVQVGERLEQADSAERARRRKNAQAKIKRDADRAAKLAAKAA
jgi:biotin carboxyl carrier protein